MDNLNSSDRTQKELEKRRKIESLTTGLFTIMTLGSIVSLILIMFFIFGNGVPTILEIGPGNFLLGTEWAPTAKNPQFGILPMIVGSVLVTAGAIVVGVPIGILTAVFMAYFCPKKIYKPLKAAINLMAGIPSIVYGFFALMVMVPLLRNLFDGTGMWMLTAILLLGIMILPTIIGLSEASIRAVPAEFYQGALGMGATHERAVMTVVVPAAKSGIASSVILGVGRAIGETMAVVMIAGNQPIMPQGLMYGVRTMTANIILEMGYASGLHRQALIATGAVLFIFILLINIAFNYINREVKQ